MSTPDDEPKPAPAAEAPPAEQAPPAASVPPAAAAPAAAAPPAEPAVPVEGDVIAGKYRIERILGRGGMGVVVAAQHVALRQKVAVKLLLPETAKREESTERFLREARAAVSIQSEHVARVMDVGTLESGAPFMVMELLSGSDLGQVLAQRGPLPVEDAVDYILQACEAIAEAHALGIVHGDLKPANLFLTTRADGSPLIKVLDFGLSKATKPDALDASLTAANVVMGSPFYMSPEQIRSLKGLDARTDIWALGVILYQLLTGTRPFEAESLAALFFTIGADQPVPPRERRADLPADLDATILACLVKDPSQRIQNVAELARRLGAFAPETGRISVERIQRVLGESGPFPRRASVAEGSAQSGALATAAANVAAPAVSAGSSVPPPADPAADKIASGSIAATAKDEIRPPSVAPAGQAKRSRGGLYAAVAGAVVLAAVAATVFGLRGRAGAVTAAAVHTSDAPAVTAAPSATAAAVVTAAAAPSMTASAAPSATPTALPSASEAASVPSAAPTAKPTAAAKAPKTPAKTPAKKADPMDRWR
jgi:serine/threonine-protein kinase